MPKPKRPNFIRMFALAVTGVFAFSAIYTVAVWKAFGTADVRAHYGEMYGGLAALFSGLAFAGVIVAIAMQKEELRLQRKELRLTRGELKRQAAAQESSSRAAERQVQLLLLTAKLNAQATLLTFYKNVPAADPGAQKAQQLAKEVEQLLDMINHLEIM